MTSENQFDLLLDGKLPKNQIKNFLRDLHQQGETENDLMRLVVALRHRMDAIKAPEDAIDIVGTGGDQHGTFNISTATAIVVAACGVPVAKHGNRSVSSRSGSSDILSALGVNLQCAPEKVQRILHRINLCFLMAPLFHSSMANVAEARKEIGHRTIFNLIGPLTNPANVRQHLIGVYDRKWLEPFACILQQLESRAAWIVHSEDGMDELTPTAVNHVTELKDNRVMSFTLDASDFGLPAATLDELRGGDAIENATALRALFGGAQNAYRSSVLMNTAAALFITNKVDDLKQGVALAAGAIDTGRAREKLDEFARATQN